MTKTTLKFPSPLNGEAEIERADRDVRATFSIAPDPENGNGRVMTRVSFVLDADGAKGLADVILAVCEEIAALPPEGWEVCTAKPAPGTQVRSARLAHRHDPREGVVLDEPVLTTLPDEAGERVVVKWALTTGEPAWADLFVRSAP